MPIEFEIDHELNALVIRVHGVVEASDFMRSLRESLKVPGFEPNMNQLLDVRSGALSLADATTRSLVDFFESAPIREALGSKYKLAFVASRPTDFGKLLMFQDHATDGR